MAKQMEKTLKKVAGVAFSILCAPLAPLVIAYYSLYVHLLPHFSKKTDNRKPSRAKTILSLLSHLIALSSLNVPLAVAIFTKVKGKLVSHVFATYVTLAFIAACERASLKCPSPARSR
jgi:hypothetical protein